MLVLGGSGGVGLFVLQLAAAAGIMTVGVGRQALHEQMLSLGASFCIDYTREDVARRGGAHGWARRRDDLVGGTLARAALAALRPGGQIAAIAAPVLDLDPILDDNITLHGVLIQDDGDRTLLAALLADGTLRPAVR